MSDEVHPDCEMTCQAGVCTKTWGDPYGCGSCCQCLGACYAQHMEQLEEERQQRNPHSIGFNPAGGIHIAPTGTGPAEAPEREHAGHLQETGMTVPAEGNPGDPDNEPIEGTIQYSWAEIQEALRNIAEYYSTGMQRILADWMKSTSTGGSFHQYTITDETHIWKRPEGTTGALEELVAETIEKHGVQPGGTDTSPAATVRLVSKDPRRARKTADTTEIPQVVSEIVSETPSYPKPRKPTKKKPKKP